MRTFPKNIDLNIDFCNTRKLRPLRGLYLRAPAPRCGSALPCWPQTFTKIRNQSESLPPPRAAAAAVFFCFSKSTLNVFKVVEAPDLKAGLLKPRAAFRGHKLGRQSYF